MSILLKSSITSIATALCIIAPGAQAHEFWIEPLDYTVATGAPVEARFRNGEAFKGSTLSWLPNRATRFEMVTEAGRVDVPAVIGDNPAFAVPGLPEGLLTILHETTDLRLTYREWAKWVKFSDHKDFPQVQEAHRNRGLPDEGFKEAYRRFAKSLVAVGEGAGADANRGLRTEFVLGANPYTDDLSGGLPVQIFLDGAGKADAQIEMFEKAPDGTVEITLHRADAEGRATLPVKPGYAYLLDSVAIEPLEPEEDGDPVWYTLWAALTFAVPEG